MFNIDQKRPNEQMLTTVGAWQLLKKIASTTSHGEIFTALSSDDADSNVYLCKKQSLRDQNKNRWGVSDREKEFLIQNASRHEHVANCFDYVEENGASSTIMEYLSPDEWSDLNDWNKENQATIGQILSIAQQLKTVITFLHTKGIIHSDIKDDNVFVKVKNGVPFIKLIDFSESLLINQELAEELSVDAMPENIMENMMKKDVMGCVDIIFRLIIGFNWRSAEGSELIYTQIQEKYNDIIAKKIVALIVKVEKNTSIDLNTFTQELDACFEPVLIA